MTPTSSDDQQASNSMPKPYAPNHYDITKDILIAVQKQKDTMKKLDEDLEFFRNKYKESLNFDNGTGCYVEDIGDKTIDLRSSMDVGNGIISAETATDYMGYKIAMDNFEMGFKRTKEKIEKIWDNIDMVRDVENGQWVRKDSLKISKWEADALEKGRKVAAPE